jgi:hypothetical protein
LKRRPPFFFLSILCFRRDAECVGLFNDAGWIPGLSWIIAVWGRVEVWNKLGILVNSGANNL